MRAAGENLTINAAMFDSDSTLIQTLGPGLLAREPGIEREMRSTRGQERHESVAGRMQRAVPDRSGLMVPGDLIHDQVSHEFGRVENLIDGRIEQVIPDHEEVGMLQRLGPVASLRRHQRVTARKAVNPAHPPMDPPFSSWTERPSDSISSRNGSGPS